MHARRYQPHGVDPRITGSEASLYSLPSPLFPLTPTPSRFREMAHEKSPVVQGGTRDDESYVGPSLFSSTHDPYPPLVPPPCPPPAAKQQARMYRWPRMDQRAPASENGKSASPLLFPSTNDPYPPLAPPSCPPSAVKQQARMYCRPGMEGQALASKNSTFSLPLFIYLFRYYLPSLQVD